MVDECLIIKLSVMVLRTLSCSQHVVRVAVHRIIAKGVLQLKQFSDGIKILSAVIAIYIVDNCSS